jgi:NADPH:quinone reductase-like Zn-dependent oxidoreductase
LFLSHFTRQRLRSLIASENGADLSVLREMMESSAVVPTIAKAFPLAESAAAIQYLQEGQARGKVVIHIDEDSAE